jgi:hypothetical protein
MSKALCMPEIKIIIIYGKIRIIHYRNISHRPINHSCILVYKLPLNFEFIYHLVYLFNNSVTTAG